MSALRRAVPERKGGARPRDQQGWDEPPGSNSPWLWLRCQPGSDLSVWFRARVGPTKGRIRRIAIVALARKLLVALWRYLETGAVPQGAVLKG
jgi:hypothetical protein